MMPSPSTPSADQTPHPAIGTAQRVLRLESEALALMAKAIPADFPKAVDLIRQLKGRVIVSGIGKSGHIARKIAATLASTGTPALFVHPSEASHGDLGMITQDDVCILISNSGETAELRDILTYTQRFSIPVIGISGKLESTLMNAATCKLLLAAAPEACAIGMAPTTSTTLTIALGDALAVALMEMRGFEAENFSVFHPGGKLGARIARVEQVMHGGDMLPLVTRETPMSETLLVMTSKGFGVAIVVDADHRLCGVITDGDLRRNMKALLQHTAGDVATKNPLTVMPSDMAAHAMYLLNQHKTTALIVVDEAQRVLGVLHIHDLLRIGVA